MGDSLSAAYGVQTEQAWVALLKNRLDNQGFDGWEVVNASISGETTDGGLRRLPGLLEKHSPDIVMIELGGNDGLRGFPPNVIRSNISKMIEQSQQAGSSVLVVGMQIPPNYGQRYTEAFSGIFPELAKEYDTELVPFFLANIYDQEGLMQDDDIHPTAEAQGQLLDNVWPVLEPMLAD
ncbi:arylesterase [Marinobacter sp. CHS3-4]|uniref:arylesterase n=1 Tax=Marinobacter sp. CHS3-4 TaxID=3045174 RepID=UPI0024B4AF6B|nr:arylesterase [Marinobacter sp. CHS3-4]MDI9246913.1 arylesterase [Marinobacter sp. CHS3-4]